MRPFFVSWFYRVGGLEGPTSTSLLDEKGLAFSLIALTPHTPNLTPQVDALGGKQTVGLPGGVERPYSLKLLDRNAQRF